jgi:uncharacterized protein YbjT (DUF2867 family)
LGATGKIGSQVMQFLSDAGIVCQAVTRDLSKATPLPLVQWTQGDLHNKEGLSALLAGSNKLFLNSGVSENMVEVQNSIIAIAKEAGIEHIVKLLTPSARPNSKDRVGMMHWHIEEYLKNSGINWNVLQPQSFMQNWLSDLADTVRAERKIYSAMGEGKKAFIDTRDIAELAYTLLTRPANQHNKIFSLSGPALVSYG